MTDKLPASLLEAVDDPALRGAPLSVLVALWKIIEPHDYRPLKAEGVATSLGLQRQTVGRALRILVSEGYLKEGKREGPYRTFRLPLTRIRPVGALNEHSRAS